MKLVEVTFIGESISQLEENMRVMRNLNITTVSQLLEALKMNLTIDFKFGNFCNYATNKICKVKLLKNDYNRFYDTFAVESKLSVCA